MKSWLYWEDKRNPYFLFPYRKIVSKHTFWSTICYIQTYGME